jgi:hypothetical protein
MHGNTKLKFSDAKQARDIYNYKNIKRKLYRTNTAIWYNKICRQKQLTPSYINIRIKGKNLQCQKTLMSVPSLIWRSEDPIRNHNYLYRWLPYQYFILLMMGAWRPKHVEKVCSIIKSASCCITSMFYLTLKGSTFQTDCVLRETQSNSEHRALKIFITSDSF